MKFHANSFSLKNYQQRPVFSSFLPGIAGEFGIPAWCYYNNRGQGVCSFGLGDKDHAIMEFLPTHTAYQATGLKGFRTFLKMNSQYIEAFFENSDMEIGMNTLRISWGNHQIRLKVTYFILPEENFGALCRRVEIENLTDVELDIELLDGMAAIVPFGVDDISLKSMTQTAKAWMTAQGGMGEAAVYKIRSSMTDTARVSDISGGNFSASFDSGGNLLPQVTDIEQVFGEDTMLLKPTGFISGVDLLADRQCGEYTQNRFPCAFTLVQTVLGAKDSYIFSSIYGQTEDVNSLCDLKTGKDQAYFDKKESIAVRLCDDLCSVIDTKTANPVFDAYCKQSYLDNVMRGGVPIFFAHEDKSVSYYIYSRKHGDTERDYNYFTMESSFFSQGNGNFRDVNQNRRCDVKFHPAVGKENIVLFFSLIQSDGYNPLVVKGKTYTLDNSAAQKLSQLTAMPEQANVFLQQPFTPGTLAMKLDEWQPTVGMEEFLNRVICSAQASIQYEFKEGYWSDHWTYNLDLLESYLEVFPEEKHNILFRDAQILWCASSAFVNPRSRRYQMTENGLRQYNALDENICQSTNSWLCDKSGTPIKSTLAEKILLLIVIKYSTLDPYGYGIEMEGGKPGWYDALNGLPGLFGSSLSESCELLRLCEFMIEAMGDEDILIFKEIYSLMNSLFAIKKDVSSFEFWDRANTAKETYRLETQKGFSGERVAVSDIKEKLILFRDRIRHGIEKAASENEILPTYYIFEAEKFETLQQNTNTIYTVTSFTAKPLPPFLEGVVKQMKLPLPPSQKLAIHKKVTESQLYDQKLKMYKVNSSLTSLTREIGRARAFSRGWLENESIWLHMEYKYLLELLKNGLYEEFFKAFYDAGVPFLNPQIYGRPTTENSSFIASSANPDPSVHGRGFVARLSGSTAEFLDIWQRMLLGGSLFEIKDNTLHFVLKPAIPHYLIASGKSLEATLFGKTRVIYQTQKPQLIPGEYSIRRYILKKDGITQTTDLIYGEQAEKIRNCEYDEIITEIY